MPAATVITDRGVVPWPSPKTVTAARAPTSARRKGKSCRYSDPVALAAISRGKRRCQAAMMS